MARSKSGQSDWQLISKLPRRRFRKCRPPTIAEVFRRFKEHNPEPKGELQHINPFTLLVAVVLSAQATDAGVNKATPALFKLADTPGKMAKLGEPKVRSLIKTIGLYRTKAKNVIALSKKLIAEHGGEVPRTREALEALPGVGRKTANVVHEYRLRRADHRGRHSYFPGRQSHRSGAGQGPPSRSRIGSNPWCRRSTSCMRIIG